MRLDAEPFHQWDESLFALRAYQLANEGRPLFNFNEFENGPDHPNGKPILFTSIQALSFKVLGYNELAMRLPVAIVCLATFLLIIYFFHKEYDNIIPGVLAALVMIGSQGYIRRHVSRTGDHDGVLAFLLLAAVLALYYWMKTDKLKYMWLFLLSLLASVLTKNIAAFLFAPGAVLYVIYKGRFLSTLSRPWIYWGVLTLGGAVVIYYMSLNWAYPGFWQHVWNHEMGGRYSNSIHGHGGPFYEYLEMMLNWQFTPWLFVIPIGIGMIFIKRFVKYRDILVLLTFVSLSELIVLSSAATKLTWYNAPLYPWLAIICGIVFYELFSSFVTTANLQRNSHQAILYMLLTVCTFGYPYFKAVDEAYHRTISLQQEMLGGLMKRIRDHHKDIKSYKLIDHNTWNLPCLFYTLSLNEHEGYDIQRLKQPVGLQVGDLVAASHGPVKDKIYEDFDMLELVRYNNSSLYKLVAQRTLESSSNVLPDKSVTDTSSIP